MAVNDKDVEIHTTAACTPTPSIECTYSLFDRIALEPDRRLHQALVNSWIQDGTITTGAVTLSPINAYLDNEVNEMLDTGHSMPNLQLGVSVEEVWPIQFNSAGVHVGPSTIIAGQMSLFISTKIVAGESIFCERGVIVEGGICTEQVAALVSTGLKLDDNHPDCTTDSGDADSFSPFANVTLDEWNHAHRMVATNVLSETGSFSILFNLLSRVKHSCDPNSAIVFIGRNGVLIAVRDIAAGEELTFQYTPNAGHEDNVFISCPCDRTLETRTHTYQTHQEFVGLAVESIVDDMSM